MGKSSYLFLAGIVIVGGTLSVLAWFTGTGKIAPPFTKQAVPAPDAASRPSSGGFLASLGLGKQPEANANLPAASPDILYLTQPVTKLFGRITKVEGSTLSLTQRFSLTPTGTKDLTFTLTVTPQTKIVRLATYVPYLLKTVPPQPDEVLSLKELVPGMVAAITTNADLRLASEAAVEATAIEVTRVSNTITGTVTKIGGNNLTVKAAPPVLPASVPPTAPPLATEALWTVAVTPQTEISRAVGAVPLSELTPGKTIAVWTREDVALATSVTALRIEPGL